jgi:hypothetical protein
MFGHIRLLGLGRVLLRQPRVGDLSVVAWNFSAHCPKGFILFINIYQEVGDLAAYSREREGLHVGCWSR